MLLGFNHRKFNFLRRNSQIHPWRDICDLKRWIAREQKLRKNLLHPSRARFRVRSNDDVIVSELEIVPDRRIKMVVVQLAGLYRPTRRV